MKSNASDYLELMAGVYDDATTKCSVEVSDLRDMMTIRSRVEKEGLSFLTITLPAFCKDFERSLADGLIAPTAFAGFRKAGAIPAFLRGMLVHLFDQETGRLLHNEVDSPHGVCLDHLPTLVESVRQICTVFKKVELPCTPAREAAAVENFVAVERELSTFVAPESVAQFSRVADLLWGTVLSNFDVREMIPAHGPGATAERVFGNQKYAWLYWYDRLEPYFPLIDTAYPRGVAMFEEELENVTIVPEEQEFPVRVVLVPKTLKSPRVIAIEPSCMQYTQQGVRDFLYRRIEGSWLTAGSVNFTDQSINQDLAMFASTTGSRSTLDLSDASDRVPLSMVKLMLRTCPELLDAILACRSTKAQIPSGLMIAPLHKFASMGSALCFPVEAMYFYTVCVMALLEVHNLPLSLASLKKVGSWVHVYGDDLIVPVYATDAVRGYLQQYNCKVNTGKSFWTGRFRESCGVDAFLGVNVTPIYLRHALPTNRRQTEAIASMVASANLFYQKGYWRTTTLIRKRIEEIVGELPYVSSDSDGLGWYSYMGYRSIDRWNEKYQRFEVRTLVPKPPRRTDVVDGYPALMKFFLRASRRETEMTPVGFEPTLWHRLASDATVNSNERSVVRGGLTLNRRWVWSKTR